MGEGVSSKNNIYETSGIFSIFRIRFILLEGERRFQEIDSWMKSKTGFLHKKVFRKGGIAGSEASQGYGTTKLKRDSVPGG